MMVQPRNSSELSLEKWAEQQLGNLKPKEIALLCCLRKNSREKLTTISKYTNIPISTLFDYLKQIQLYLIKKYTVILNFADLGYNCHAFVTLRVPLEHKSKSLTFLMTANCINSIYRMNNGSDFMVETVHKTIRDLNMFVEYMQNQYNITHYDIHYLLDELKKEEFIPLHEVSEDDT